jgi:hypothetical protein
LETSLKYVKPKVETKVEQSGTWLKALAEAAAKMVPMVVQHRPTQSSTSPLPSANTHLACSHMWAVQQGPATEIGRDSQE